MIKKYDISYQVFDQLEDFSLCPLVEDYVPGESCDTNFTYFLQDNNAREIM